MRSVDFAYRASVIVGEIALDSSYVTADVTNETSLCNWSGLLGFDLLFGAIGRSVLGSFSFDYVVIIGVGHGGSRAFDGIGQTGQYKHMCPAVDSFNGLKYQSSRKRASDTGDVVNNVVTESIILVCIARTEEAEAAYHHRVRIL